jgi:hypothetical protein
MSIAARVHQEHCLGLSLPPMRRTYDRSQITHHALETACCQERSLFRSERAPITAKQHHQHCNRKAESGNWNFDSNERHPIVVSCATQN